MPKKYNYEMFVLVDNNGNKYEVTCYTTDTRIRVTEHATCWANGAYVEGKDYWYNRPWYRFTYENAIRQLAEKIAKGDKAMLKAFKTCIDAKAKSVSDACDAMFKSFKKDYDSLSDTTKKHLANSGVVVTSAEQAQDVMKVSKAFDAMFRLMDDDKGSAN